MTDIPRLIEELEAATEGSIGLDVQVLHACGFGNSEEYPLRDGTTWLLPTRSVEDALKLTETVLSRSDVEIVASSVMRLCRARILHGVHVGSVSIYRGCHRSCAVAVSIALISAVREMQRRREAA